MPKQQKRSKRSRSKRKVRKIFGYVPRLKQYVVLYNGSNDLHTVHRHALRKPASTRQKVAHFWARNPQWHFEGKWHANAVMVSEIKNNGVGLIDAWEVINTPADVERLAKGDVPTEDEKNAEMEWENGQSQISQKEIKDWYAKGRSAKQVFRKKLTKAEISSSDVYKDYVTDSDSEPEGKESNGDEDDETKSCASADRLSVKRECSSPSSDFNESSSSSTAVTATSQQQPPCGRTSPSQIGIDASGSVFGPQQDAQSYRIDESRLLQIASAAMDDTDGTIESPSTTSAADQKAIELQSASQSTGEELGKKKDEKREAKKTVAQAYRMLANLQRVSRNIDEIIDEAAFKRSRVSAIGPHGDPDAMRLAIEVFSRLCYYSREGNVNEVKSLLTREEGSEFLDLNKQDSLGITVAHIVAMQRCPKDQHTYCRIMKLLFQQAANINAKDYTMQTPVMKAALAGSRCMLQMLVRECGAKLAATDLHGNSTLSLACEHRVAPVIIAELLALGADVNQVCAHDRSTIALQAFASESITGRLLHDYFQKLQTAFEVELRRNLPSTCKIVRAACPLYTIAASDHQMDSFRLKFNPAANDIPDSLAKTALYIAAFECSVDYIVNEQCAAESEKISNSSASGGENRIEFDIVCSTGKPWPVHSVMLNEGAAKKNSKNGLYVFYTYEANGINTLQIDFDPLSASTLGATIALQAFITVTTE